MKNLRYFAGSFVLGLVAFSVSMAAIPTRNQPAISEIQANKVTPPAQEDEFSRLNAMENRYSESWEQQQRLRAATKRVAGGDYSAPKKKVRR